MQRHTKQVKNLQTSGKDRLNTPMTSTPDAGKPSPIPEIGFNEILGLLEVLKRIGGKQDIYQLAANLKMEFGLTLGVIRAAEMLHFVHTPGGDVVLEPLGEKVINAKIQKRKELIRKELERLPLISQLRTYIEAQDGHQATRDQVMEFLAELFPNEDAEVSFKNLVNWVRFADIFAYNDDTQAFFIDQTDGQEI